MKASVKKYDWYNRQSTKPINLSSIFHWLYLSGVFIEERSQLRVELC